MAGLGEVCTHIAAIMFYIETAGRLNGVPTCTQKACQWVVPAYQKDIPYAPLRTIDFSSAKSKKRAIDATTDASINSAASYRPEKPQIKQEAVQSLYIKLRKCGSKPAILSLLPQYVGNQSGLSSSSKSAGFPDIKCLEQILSFLRILSVRSAREIAAIKPSLRLRLSCSVFGPFPATIRGTR